MKWLILGLSVAVLALLGVAAVIDLQPGKSRQGGGSLAADGEVGLARYVEQGRRIRDASLARRFPANGKVLATAVSSDQLLAEDPRRVALSPAELGWLQKHHYPTDKELSALAAIVPVEAANLSDPHAATLQGLAMLQRGQAAEGIDLLRKAAAMGGIYGYEEAAIAEHAMRRSRSGATDDADDQLRAHLEVARILGDYKVDYLLGRYLPAYAGRDPDRAFAMQKYTSEFLRQLGLQAQAMGVTAPGPDPRPGAEQWRDLRRLGDAGESTTVDVYVAR